MKKLREMKLLEFSFGVINMVLYNKHGAIQ